MEQIPTQNQEIDLRAKQRERSTIAILYRIEKLLLYLYVIYIGLLLLTVLLGLIFMHTVEGAFILSGAIPWTWILPISLCAAFAFPLADSFIQGSEEQWFMRYGTTILASVAGFDPIKGFKWPFFGRSIEEYRAQLAWRQPDSEQMFSYSLRVRDQKLPKEGSALPVTIDYDDPAYYLKRDIKDSSILF
ncbi:MAG: hypothetical protein H0U76_10530 [Ktedonobacteraceae bacterium]|nr:hypothetical protein [Ktedonobacteraceae bacterium]